MATAGKYSFIRLALDDGPTIPLSLEVDFVLTAGLKPNINAFVVPPHIYEALKAAPLRTGTLQFWYNDPDEAGTEAGPGEPNYKLAKVSVLDVEPVLFERPPGDPPRVAKYRLHIADRRQAFVLPRGGVLRFGKVNPAGSASPLGNRRLIEKCLEAMGFKVGQGCRIVGDPNSRPQIWDLDWRGNHAPTELAKILDEIDYVCALQSDGSLLIAPRGDGSLPVAVPDDQLLVNIDLPAVDRRGKDVVFTSYPNAAIVTQTLYGPSADTWEFVAMDHNDRRWKRLEELSILSDRRSPLDGGLENDAFGRTPAELLRQDFRELDLELRAYYRAQFYYFLRLNPALHPHAVLRPEIKDSQQRQLLVHAKIARLNQDGKWYNSRYWVPCHVTYLHNPSEGISSILQVYERLGRVDSDGYAGAMEDSFVPLRRGDIRIRVSYEAVELKDGKPMADEDGLVKPRYFEMGFKREDGQIVELDDLELAGALIDPDTIVVQRPDWILYEEAESPASADDEEKPLEAKNREALEAMARTLAPQYLAEPNPAKMILVKGFAAAELTGQVSEIRITQRPPQTTLKLNTWWVPSGGLGLDAWRKQIDLQKRYPMQGAVQASRQAIGADPLPVVPVMPFGSPGGAVGGMTVRYGVVQVLNGNTVTLKPCTSATDATATGEADVTAYAVSPVSASPALDLAAGNIVAFVSGAAAAHLLPVKQGAGDDPQPDGLVIPVPTVARTLLTCFQGQTGAPDHLPAIIGWDFVVGV